MIADLAAISFALAGGLRVSAALEPRVPLPDLGRSDLVELWLVSMLAHVLLLHAKSMYAPRRQASRLREAAILVQISAIGTTVLAAWVFFSGRIDVSRLALGSSFLFGALLLVSFRLNLRFVLRAARRRGFNLRNVLIAGTGRLAVEVARGLHAHPEMGFRIVGFVGPNRLGRRAAAPIVGPYDKLGQLVERLEVDQVFIAFDRCDAEDPLKLVEALRDSTASVRIATDLSGLQTIRATGETLDGIPMLCVVDTPVVGWAAVAKRAMDISLAGAALIALSPVLPIVALAILWRSPGKSVLYRQRRVSLDAREFMMLKFRTMVPGAENETGPTWARPNDPRCTRLGALLRRYSLDELPQLWNVMRGDMSLVGPRPERPELIESFRHQIGGYMLRHKVKGGLTGLAQVNGLRGDTPLEQRIAFDLRYAAQWSLTLDLKILALTALRVFRDPNAY